MSGRLDDILTNACMLGPGEWTRYRFRDRDQARVFMNQLSAKRAAGYKASKKMYDPASAEWGENLWPGVTWRFDPDDETMVLVGKAALPMVEEKLVTGPDGKLVVVEKFPYEVAMEAAEE